MKTKVYFETLGCHLRFDSVSFLTNLCILRNICSTELHWRLYSLFSRSVTIWATRSDIRKTFLVKMDIEGGSIFFDEEKPEESFSQSLEEALPNIMAMNLTNYNSSIPEVYNFMCFWFFLLLQLYTKGDESKLDAWTKIKCRYCMRMKTQKSFLCC